MKSPAPAQKKVRADIFQGFFGGFAKARPGRRLAGATGASAAAQEFGSDFRIKPAPFGIRAKFGRDAPPFCAGKPERFAFPPSTGGEGGRGAS